MQPLRCALSLLLLLTFALGARSEELRVVGRHQLEGAVGGRAFGGWLEVLPDATYRGERRYADGAVEVLGGAVAIDQRELVLRPATGAVGLLTGGPGTERRYSRDDDGRTPRWKLDQAGERELLRQDQRSEPEWWHLLKRLTVEGFALRWLFADNLGKVDRAPLILRSKAPSPGDLMRWKARYGLKTVLSLNGEQDREARLWRFKGPVPFGRKVNVRQFIAQLGLRHEVLHMSASRAPTDAELVAVFRVLLDDSRKPILIHCKGGSDRTGIISALYAVEFLGASKQEAKKSMRCHLWAATSGTEVQGAYLDLYQPGTIRRLLQAAGVPIPARYVQVP